MYLSQDERMMIELAALEAHQFTVEAIARNDKTVTAGIIADKVLLKVNKTCEEGRLGIALNEWNREMFDD